MSGSVNDLFISRKFFIVSVACTPTVLRIPPVVPLFYP